MNSANLRYWKFLVTGCVLIPAGMPAYAGTKDSRVGVCMVIYSKALGASEPCIIKSESKKLFDNVQLHANKRIINIDTTTTTYGPINQRHSVNGLDAERYYKKGGDSGLMIATPSLDNKGDTQDWTCYKSIVVNVCYK